MPAAIDQRTPAFRELAHHWETWVGVLMCAVCGGAGGYASAVYFQRSPLPLLLGGAVGGFLYSLMVRLVRRRYGLPPPELRGALANAVELYFRDDGGARLMVPEGPKSRYGYRVHSPEQEGLLRAYVSMRLWTQTAIMLLGVIGFWFAVDLPRRWNALANHGDAARLVIIALLAYFALLVAPVLLFERVSRQIEAKYFAAAERVTVTPLPTALAARRALLAVLGAGLLVAALLLLAGVLVLAPHPHR